jgi:cyclopropane-fatty-acyl-phospholipid synthase
MIDSEEIDINADKNSDSNVLALLEKQFPGSWLPYSVNQIIEDAEPFFKLMSKSSGRLDYIETQKQWSKKYRQFSFRKYIFYLSLLPSYLTSKELRKRIEQFGIPANRLCFEREIFDHYRLVFEKV